MPTSTTERGPSAAAISASWDALALADETVSDITSEPQLNATDAAFRVTYTTPASGLARDSCNGRANMVVVTAGSPSFPMVNIAA
jgi:hypothetical protein